MNLTPAERQIGRENYQNAVGVTRRDLLKAAMVAPAAGAFYFGYQHVDGNPVRAGLIGAGEQGRLLLSESNPDFVQFIAYSDVRPSQIAAARLGDEAGQPRIGFLRKYDMNEERFQREINFYEDYHKLLENPDIELVVIALPLHLHHQAVAEALLAGKHVLCETLMAKDVRQCKEMARQARETGLHLAVGHQRHYSLAYDNVVSLLTSDLLGDIHHVRAWWHRNEGCPRTPGDPWTDSWHRPVPEEDWDVDFSQLGYESRDELCRWRLFHRTSGGLMAELGTHQLDACGLVIGGAPPLAVSGVGKRVSMADDREVDDHVIATIEYPGKQHPRRGVESGHEDDILIVSYSAISTNATDRYGEQIMGTRGTLLIEAERDVMLFRESSPEYSPPPRQTSITVIGAGTDHPVLEASESVTGPTSGAGWAQQAVVGQTSRGFGEQLEHLAWCIRNPAPEHQPRCGPVEGLANAVVTLTTNLALRRRERIEFKPEWFDPESEEVPDDQ